MSDKVISGQLGATVCHAPARGPEHQWILALALAGPHRDDILTSIANESRILKHLHSKLTTEHLEYKPNDNQRTINELLQYLSRMTLSMTTMIQDQQYIPEKQKQIRLDSEAKNMLTDFSAALDEQHAFLETYLSTATTETLDTVCDLFGSGNTMPLKTYILDIAFKNYPAYRMQLFQYMKT